MKKRKQIASDNEKKVLIMSRRRCCLCWGLLNDNNIKRGQIAHLDRDPSNSNLENLIFLCLEHHDQYDSKTSQSKGLREVEVKHYRELLYKAMWSENFDPVQTDTVFSKGVDFSEQTEKSNKMESQGELQISPRIHTGKELVSLFQNVHVRSLNSSELSSGEEAELVGNFFRYLEDLHDFLGMGMSAGDIIETEFALNLWIEELEGKMLYVYGKHLVQDDLVVAVIHVVRQKMTPDQTEVEWNNLLREFTSKGTNAAS